MMTSNGQQPPSPAPAQDPDLQRLEREQAMWMRQAKRRPDPYADGQAYYREQADIRDAQAHVTRLAAQIAGYRQRTKALRQKIAIAYRQLHVPEDAHRAKIARVTQGRTTSSRGCTEAELQQILDEYRGAGFKPARPKRAGKPNQPPADALERGPMLRKIQALLAEQKLPWAYAEAILRRQRGLPPGTACPIHLVTAEQARGVIAALSRRARKARPD